MATIFTGELLIKRTLGQGGFAQVFLVSNLTTKEQFALKCESKETKEPQLLREAEIMREVQGPGIPKIHSVGETESCRYIVEELLGSNLAEYSNRGLRVAEKADIIQRCIDRLEFVHSCGYTHNDVKPANFCIGLDGSTLYLTDFGLASKFERHHIDYRENMTFCGTAAYASLGVHMGVCPSRRDDLESVLLIAIRLFSGKLPWERLGLKDPQRKQVAIRELKLGISVEQLCSGLPRQLRRAFQYVRTLKFTETPNYDLLRSYFAEIKDEVVATPMQSKADKPAESHIRRFSLAAAQRRYRSHFKSLPTVSIPIRNVSNLPRQPSSDDDSLQDFSSDEEKTIRVPFMPVFRRDLASRCT